MTAQRKSAHKEMVCVVFGVLLLALGSPGEAQQPKKVPRIEFLSASTSSSYSDRIKSFQQGLREHGYENGKNIILEYKFAEGNADRLRELASELVNLKVDVIVTAGPEVTRAAKQATSTIATVMAQDNDPVGNGFVASLARPGGNITGFSQMAPEIVGKQMELLKESIPRLSRVAILGNLSRPGTQQELKNLEVVARELKLQLNVFDVPIAIDIETAFRNARNERDGAVLGLTNAALFSQRTRVAELALKNHLPLIYGSHEWAEAGALMSYGTNFEDLYRRVATYVDKILKGAKPAELPVEQPTKFEFVINLRTAKEMGFTIPQAVLYRADRVIR